jgi:hypothetical protein
VTDQIPDRIIIDGVSRTLFTFPLDMYRERYRRDMVFYQASPSTDCWRGYIGEWEIDDEKLFLLNVDGHVSYKGRHPSVEVKDDPRWGELHPELIKYRVPITLSELFGPAGERVPATWYSGNLRLASYWGSPNYDTIAVTDGICGERRHVVGSISDDLTPFDDQTPF